jgi:hypothetical protein
MIGVFGTVILKKTTRNHLSLCKLVEITIMINCWDITLVIMVKRT